MLAKRNIAGVDVEIELGVVSGSNPEHKANIHLLIKGIAHVRGIMVYHKPDGWVLRMPGYNQTPDSKYKTAYIMLSPEIVNFIIQTVELSVSGDFVKTYSGPKIWTIWATLPKVEQDGPDESDRCNVEDAGDY